MPPEYAHNSDHDAASPRDGFTLVELLVVIAILAILAVLVVPSISGGIEKAQTAEDMNKLKQIGGATAAFVADNNGRLPNDEIPIPGTALTADQPDRWVWPEVVDRYFEQAPQFVPPSAYNWLKRVNSPFFSKACDPYPSFQLRATYPLWTRPIAFGFNIYINDDRWKGYVNRMPNASKLVIVAELNGDEAGVLPEQTATTRSDVHTRYRISRPGSKALYLFGDYHVEAITGDRGISYFEAHPAETNMWRWW